LPSDGLKTDRRKVAAIRHMPRPTDQPGVPTPKRCSVELPEKDANVGTCP